MIPTQKISAPERLEAQIQESPSIDTTQKDPLIDRGLQTWQYIGIVAIAVSSIAIVRVFSSKFEHALLFAVALSIILIAFLLTV